MKPNCQRTYAQAVLPESLSPSVHAERVRLESLTYELPPLQYYMQCLFEHSRWHKVNPQRGTILAQLRRIMDGSTHTVADDIDQIVWRGLSTRNGGETVSIP